MSAHLPQVLDLFIFLFGPAWVTRWQRQWTQAQAAAAAAAPSPRRPNRPCFYQRIFCLRVTLWYLLFQRLQADHSLAAVVVNVRSGGADRLRPKRAPLSRKVRSTKTSGYNQARQRLPLAFLQAALAHFQQGLLKLVGLAPAPTQPPPPGQRTRQLLDGSTLAVLLTPALAKDYPPAANQHGTSDWCLLRILVGFCARSGAVLSAIEGPRQQSEQALAWQLMAAAAFFVIWIGDRNFGVWSVVAKAVHHRQDVLVRMTKARAAKLCGHLPLASGQERLVQWAPSRHDKIPPGTPAEPVSGRLLYLRVQRGGKWMDLWLFTTLPAADYPLELLAQWYGLRWQAEVHFRTIKTHMDLAELNVVSPEMARKEFYAALLAYSLVRAVLWQAGERLETGQSKLSFAQARRVLVEALGQWGRSQIGLRGWSQKLVEEVAQHTLPKRRKPRPSEIRCVRHRRLRFPPLKGSRADARARAHALEAKSL